ncbi:MAG: BMA_0021/BMA_0022 family TOMM bacteriocin, partial [Kofleriaceae bacterium]
MSMNKLMEFRTVFLRSIAEAWFDDGFRTALLRDAEGALRDKFGFQWPWAHVCKLVIMSSHGQFEWLSNEWVYASTLHESLILRVPLDPSPIDPPLRASALSDYYRQHASLFDDAWGQAPIPRIVAPVAPPPARPGAHPTIGPGSAAPVGGFMPTDDEFASFKVALL